MVSAGGLTSPIAIVSCVIAEVVGKQPEDVRSKTGRNSKTAKEQNPSTSNLFILPSKLRTCST